MIPILYKSTETNFSHNGLGLLKDAVYCYPEEVGNGSYELELTYPVGSFLYGEIKGQRIIKAKANDRYDYQLFRIYYISKPLRGQITVKAEHISYKLKDNFVKSLSFSGNCGGALNALNSNAAFASGFNFNSDITTTAKLNVERKNLLTAIIGSKDSVLIKYGGDVVRDNFNFYIKANGGLDKNVLIAFKKNMTGFTCEEDWSNCVTRIYPFAIVDDETITLSEEYVDSAYINNYPNPKILDVDFSSYFEEDEEINEDNLRDKASTYFEDTKCDIPTLNYNIEFVALSKTEEYKHMGLTEDIGMYDTVIIRHEIYGLDTKVKVIKAKYDSITEKYIKIELGQPKANLASLFSDVDKNIKEATKDKVTTGFLDKSIKELSDAITGNDGGYIRLNPPENPSELLVLDNEDINLAQTVWRWNKSGWGVSTTGYNGSFYGMTKNGKLVIDEVSANKFNAAMIRAGLLQSLNGIKWINLDDGTFNFAQGALTFDPTNGLQISDGNVTLNRNGVEIRNGSIKVFNSDDEVALYVNTRGNVSSLRGYEIEDGSGNTKSKLVHDGVYLFNNGTKGMYATNSNLVFMGASKFNNAVDAYDLYINGTHIDDKIDSRIPDSDVSISNLNVDADLDMEWDGGNSSYEINNVFYIDGRKAYFVYLEANTRLTAYNADVDNDLWVGGSLDVEGSKPCLQITENYGKRRVTAYETAEYYFGDVGRGIIGPDGSCIITIEDIFKECVNTDIDYEVTLQNYKGMLRQRDTLEMFPNYFIVYGEEGTTFGWEIKAKRKGYENVRLEEKIDLKDEEDITNEDFLLKTETIATENILLEGND